MILPIKHTVYWELIRQRKQTQINKDHIRKNTKRVDHKYYVIDKVIINNHVAYKYENPYKGPFVITRCFTNGTAILKYGAKKIRCNICRIKLYKYNTNV